MIHGASRLILQFIAASFGVWAYRNRFLRSIMNVVQHFLNQSNFFLETSSEILIEERHVPGRAALDLWVAGTGTTNVILWNRSRHEHRCAFLLLFLQPTFVHHHIRLAGNSNEQPDRTRPKNKICFIPRI